MTRRLPALLVTLVCLLAFPASASALSITLNGPANGASVLTGSSVPVSASISLAGCASNDSDFPRWLYEFPGESTFYPSYGDEKSTKTMLHGSLITAGTGVYHWYAYITCGTPDAHGLTAQTETRSYRVVDKLPPKPKGKALARKRRATIGQTYRLAKRTRGLAKKGKAVQKKYAKTKSGKSKKSFGDWLASIKDFFEAKDKLKEEYEKYFGKKEPKKADLSKYEAPAAGFRKAQLLQLPQFTKQLEKLGDFRNVAVRAAISAEQRSPELKSQLDLAAGLYRADATFDALSPQEQGDVATQYSIMVQTGAAKRLVAEMNDAGKSATNLVFAH
jgi:hypothetical protein